MPETWLRLAILLLLVWFIADYYQNWCLVSAINKSPLQCPKVKKKATKADEEFQGVTRKPVCTECEMEKQLPLAVRLPPPLIVPKKGRPKSVETGLHYCPKPRCPYYGWIGWGNISSNGHPNRGRQRQLYCCGCKGYFSENIGTLFYRKRFPAEQIVRAMASLAEGVGIRAVGRIFEVEPETVLAWLVAAAQQLEAFNSYMTRQLAVEQVQLDELYGVIRAYQTGELSEPEALAALDRPRKSVWLWTAIDPLSKFWLAFEVGDRTAESAWKIVHKVAMTLKKGIVPLFVTDGNRAYEQPILSHYGEWCPPAADQRKPRWRALPTLLYAQVVKKRRGRRVVSVSKRVVFGTLSRITDTLSASGRQINTAFVERLNPSAPLRTGSDDPAPGARLGPPGEYLVAFA